MNQESYNGWLDAAEHAGVIYEAAELDVDRIRADERAADILAEAARDAGFEAGVEAQKHGLGEA